MRKPLTAQEKWEILLEALGSSSGPDAICMRRGISLTELRQWLALARSGALERLAQGQEVPSSGEGTAGSTTGSIRPKEVVQVAPAPSRSNVPEKALPLPSLAPINLDNLFSLVTHELKEPIRGIRALCQFVEEDFSDQLPERARSYLTMMTESANRLQLLVDGLGEYARVLRAVNLTARVGLASLVERIRTSLQPLIQARNALVVVDSLLPDVRGDHAALMLAFRHLIQNGLIFNRSESPRVEIVLGSAPTPGWVVVEVRDNGIGVDPRHWQKMFDLFQRLNRYEEYPSAGAGLAIAAKVIQAHGGRLEISTSSGEGSVFQVWLPDEAP